MQEDLKEISKEELEKIGLLNGQKILGGVVIRQPKAYPSYSGNYSQFADMRKHFDAIDNLILIGRNGMHRYNNQDHSMLTAMEAVDGIVAGNLDRNKLWSINTEEGYHESRK